MQISELVLLHRARATDHAASRSDRMVLRGVSSSLRPPEREKRCLEVYLPAPRLDVLESKVFGDAAA